MVRHTHCLSESNHHVRYTTNVFFRLSFLTKANFFFFFINAFFFFLNSLLCSKPRHLGNFLFHRVFRFCRLLRRLATLLSQQASLMASNEAFKKQAEGASNAAKKYMDENELLQEVNLRTFTHTHRTSHDLIAQKVEEEEEEDDSVCLMEFMALITNLKSSV